MKSIIIIIALTGICAVGAWAATLSNDKSRRVALHIGKDYVIPKLGGRSTCPPDRRWTFSRICDRLSAVQSVWPDELDENLVPQYSKDVDFRTKRQSNATTTARPRKDRPSNVFKLISVLISETRNDTSRAFNEIGNLFNSQFAENTPKPTKSEHAVSSTTPDPSSESDEDNEITTTTEPYRITREEFFGILRSNVRGLMRLFQKELGNALRDTTKNARKFGKEFRNAIMPYVT